MTGRTSSSASAPVVIARVATAHPNRRMTRAEAATGIIRLTGDERRVRALANGSCIDERAIALSADEIERLDGIEERNRIYARLAPPLAVEAAAGVLRGEVDVGCLTTTSCTGYMVPGWDGTLVETLSLPRDAVRLPITEAGCSGGVLAVARAADYLRSRPGQRALAVSAELCSLAFHACLDEGNLISTLIFADGAGAALLSSDDQPRSGLEILDSMSYLVPEARHVLGFDLTDRGFYPILGRELARALPAPTLGAATTLLDRNRLSLRDVDFWLLHPGGPRVLERLEQALGVERCRDRWSWESLRSNGNTSSAAIFDVLRRYLADPSAPGGTGVVAAFGPGLSIELLLVRRC